MKFLSLLVTFLLGFFLVSNAQRNCGTELYSKTVAKQSFHKETISTNESNATARDTIANEIINIPVVIHILYNNASENISDAQVLSQLKSLNEDFSRTNLDAANTPQAFRQVAADVRINFCLSKTDPQGRPTGGIIRKSTSKTSFSLNDGMKFSAAGGDNAWDCKKYLNIWVCNLGGQTLGYASIPEGEADKDGIVVNYDAFGTVGTLRANFNKGRSATHEVGHWLGLKHVWGDNDCGNDNIEDTPQQEGSNFNCPSFPHISACSPNANGDMFMDFMDYTDDGCMNMFTTGQKNKMRSLFSANGSKNSFLYSFACNSSEAGGAPVVSADVIVTSQPDAAVKIFPNPVSQYLNLVPLNGYDLTDKSITIFNTSGGIVLKQIFSKNSNQLNVSTLSAGIYILTIGQGADKKVLKLIKM